MQQGGEGDVAAAAPLHPPFRPKSSLMKKLGFLLLPKKSKSKSGSPSQKPAPLPPPSAGHGSELELLFAQAEATLGELLVRAGASFEARSSYSSLADPHHHSLRASDRSHGEEDISALVMASSSTAGSRSAKFSGHAKRRSLSRVWQQLGGSLFCGSGHMNAYVMDQDMMAPAPSKGPHEDVILDEAYWQSLADAMLLQQQQQRHQQQLEQGAIKAAADDTVQGQDELSCSNGKEVQNDQQQESRDHNAEQIRVEEAEDDRESEIVPSIDAESMAKLKWPSPICGSSGRSSAAQDMDSMYYRNLVDVESGGGCTRLNTTLDESPNLAHNYLVMKVGGASNRPEANSQRDMGGEAAQQAMAAQSSSSSMQPLERFLWQARSDVAGPSNLASGGASAPSSRSAPDSLTCQEPAGVDTISCRVSLMTLLHEEAAAGEPTPTLDARPEEEEAEAAAALLEEEGRRTRSTRSTSMAQVAGEDPLQCCVCMIRRKGAALIPCGHTFCRTCAKHLFAGRGACPLCNNLIVQVLDIF